MYNTLFYNYFLPAKLNPTPFNVLKHVCIIVNSSNSAGYGLIIVSDNNTSQWFTGLFTGVLISRFGLRRISIVGGIMAPLGFILAFLATSITHLYICIGVIAGTVSRNFVVLLPIQLLRFRM